MIQPGYDKAGKQKGLLFRGLCFFNHIGAFRPSASSFDRDSNPEASNSQESSAISAVIQWACGENEELCPVLREGEYSVLANCCRPLAPRSSALSKISWKPGLSCTY